MFEEDQKGSRGIISHAHTDFMTSRCWQLFHEAFPKDASLLATHPRFHCGDVKIQLCVRRMCELENRCIAACRVVTQGYFVLGGAL
jgi:hypothetical protein